MYATDSSESIQQLMQLIAVMLSADKLLTMLFSIIMWGRPWRFGPHKSRPVLRCVDPFKIMNSLLPPQIKEKNKIILLYITNKEIKSAFILKRVPFNFCFISFLLHILCLYQYFVWPIIISHYSTYFLLISCASLVSLW